MEAENSTTAEEVSKCQHIFHKLQLVGARKGIRSWSNTGSLVVESIRVICHQRLIVHIVANVQPWLSVEEI